MWEKQRAEKQRRWQWSSAGGGGPMDGGGGGRKPYRSHLHERNSDGSGSRDADNILLFYFFLS
jgi:hypothetical protein